MASKFESLPDRAVFKICQKLIGQEIDFDNFEELTDAVKEVGSLFKIDAGYEDFSFIKSYLKSNYESLINNDPSKIVKPTLKVYRVPYYVIESIVQRQEYVWDLESYDENPNDIANFALDLESEGYLDIWEGSENPERDTDIVDSNFDNWELRTKEIKQIK